jgi:hypothetical protein
MVKYNYYMYHTVLPAVTHQGHPATSKTNANLPEKAYITTISPIIFLLARILARHLFSCKRSYACCVSIQQTVEKQDSNLSSSIQQAQSQTREGRESLWAGWLRVSTPSWCPSGSLGPTCGITIISARATKLCQPVAMVVRCTVILRNREISNKSGDLNQ